MLLIVAFGLFVKSVCTWFNGIASGLVGTTLFLRLTFSRFVQYSLTSGYHQGASSLASIFRLGWLHTCVSAITFSHVGPISFLCLNFLQSFST